MLASGSLGCNPFSDTGPSQSEPSPTVVISADPENEPPTQSCPDPIPVYAEGQQTGTVCKDAVAEAGLTVVDLSDSWTPRLFDVPADAPPLPYRARLLALQNEVLGDGPEWDRARRDRYLELYGVFPSLTVVARRMAEHERHACRRAVEDDALAKLAWETNPWKGLTRQRAEVQGAAKMRRQLDEARESRDLSSIDDLADDRIYGRLLSRYRRITITAAAVEAMQRHLECEGLITRKVAPGLFDEHTIVAMQTYQRKEMLVGWRLDEQTASALMTDPEEGDFRSLLRVLRERVTDATGLLEDGSALGQPGRIVGRTLDGEAFRGARGHTPHVQGAPDLIAQATDAAARALGWTEPEAAQEFLSRHFPVEGRPGQPRSMRALEVALRLPPAPTYHSDHMQIRVEVDRGDIVYEFPHDATGARLQNLVKQRPATTLYASTGDGEIALVRWGTTVGGWKPERTAGGKMGMVYKGSPVGERVWRDIVATPAWIPPSSAPRRDLVRPRTGGGWAAKTDLFGPSYASAYGLVMLIHHRQAEGPDGEPRFYDAGIRTHGSVRYDSIHHGTSHGCHRLHNHRAVRLAGFLLRHRKSELRGPMELNYTRSFTWYQKAIRLHFDSRGYRFELTPPVPVQILKGHILGKQTKPSTQPKRLPRHLAKRFMGEMMQP